MKIRKLHILLFLIIAWTAGFSQKNETGVLNYGCLEEIKVIPLEGYWEFYWSQLLTPKQLRDSSYPHILARVPRSWTKYQIDSVNLPNYGFATYHVKIIVPQKDRLYSLKIFDVFSAYRVWINDSLFLSVGKVTDNPDEFVPKKQTHILTFFTRSDTIDLVIQIANYTHRKAGLVKAPKFGDPDRLISGSELKISFDFLLFGGLLIFSLFHFWLFFYRKRFYETLYFAISTLAAAFYTFFDEELIITELIPNLDWELIYKGDYITNYFRVLFLGLYFYVVVKGYVNGFWRWFAKIILGLIGFMSLLVIVTPVYVYSFTLNPFLVLTALIYIFGLYGFIQKVVQEHETMVLIPVSGYIFLGLTMINDFLMEINVLNTVELSNFGIFIFVTTQSITLAQKHSKLYQTAERLSKHFEKLDVIKRSLLQIPFNNYEYLLRTLKDYFGARNIYLFDMTTGALKPAAGILDDKYYSDKDLPRIDSHILMEFLELSLSVDEPLLLTDKNRLVSYIKMKKNLKVKSLLITRLGNRNRPLGVLYMENEKGYFTTEQKRILQLTTTQITAIISNIKLFNNLDEINKNLMDIVRQRTAKIEEQNKELELRTIDLDEKIEELRVTAEIISEMNNDLREQKELVEKKNALLKQQTEILKKQKALVDELNRQITDSVNYARRIQMALLTSETNLPQCKNYIIFIPREVVSGDFWWFKQIQDLRILIFGDTGLHGVAGAFMSILSFSILNEMTTVFASMDKNLITPGLIADEFDRFLEKLRIEGSQNVKISVLIFDRDGGKAQAALRKNYGYLITGGELVPLFDNGKDVNEFDLTEKDEIVLYTDGFVKELRKLNHITSDSKVTDILENLKNLNFDDQKIYIENLLVSSSERADDILFIAIKFEI